jgi:hypothetical protein
MARAIFSICRLRGHHVSCFTAAAQRRGESKTVAKPYIIFSYSSDFSPPFPPIAAHWTIPP